jgi:integrase
VSSWGSWSCSSPDAKLTALRAEREAGTELRRRIADRVRSGELPVSREAAEEVRASGWARHTYAAFMIAAGVNAKALSSYMGHSTISLTLDRYGHLMPGNEDEAAVMLADYLERDAQPAPSRLESPR